MMLFSWALPMAPMGKLRAGFAIGQRMLTPIRP